LSDSSGFKKDLENYKQTENKIKISKKRQRFPKNKGIEKPKKKVI
jgi:hypothetical protein